MDINTRFSSTSGATAAASTVLKRRTAQQDAPAAFMPLADGPVQSQGGTGGGGERDSDAVISTPEKQYFESLFPNSVDAIRSYSPYQRNGMQQSAGLGRLVDVKG